MIGFDEAARLVTALAVPLGSEEVELSKAAGRVLAEPVIAQVDSPWADVSTMDGYAVREADLRNLPARLTLVRESFAGTAEPGSIVEGECSRIFTGAPLPEGADRVVVQEIVGRDGPEAVFERPPESGRNIRRRGADFVAGAVLLEAGVVLGPRQLVAAAAGDLNRVRCWRRPRVYVLATGDELAEPGTARLNAGKIPESVSFGIAALVDSWGGEFAGRTLLGDSLAETGGAPRQALGDGDIVVVIGGASVGERDLSKEVFAGLGIETIFSKVAIKPGKPVWLARAGDKLVLGLPGNPSSAMVTARLFLAPLLAGHTGRSPASAWRWREAQLGGPLPPTGDREVFVRGRIGAGGLAVPIENQDSGAQHPLAGADVLIRRPAHDQALAAGVPVPTIDF